MSAALPYLAGLLLLAVLGYLFYALLFPENLE